MSWSTRWTGVRPIRGMAMTPLQASALVVHLFVAANGEAGNTMPPTVRTLAIFDNAGAPRQRSMASVSARRTRGSSNGFFLWLGVTRLPQFQSLC